MRLRISKPSGGESLLRYSWPFLAVWIVASGLCPTSWSPWAAPWSAPGALAEELGTELDSFSLPEGFKIELFAAEPDVINPLQINFDARGRLWVACAPTYPQVEPQGEPRDKIVILEDRDGDGRAEIVKTFATGLMVTTGLAPGNGGVYVGQANSLLFMKDTDGDDKADVQRVVYAGFGAEDMHHALNSFRWGPGGALYFNQGIYIHSHVETPYGQRILHRGGVWQFRPRTLQLDVYDNAIAGTNTWGHVFDSWGHSMVTTSWPEGIYSVLPESPLANQRDRIIPDLNVVRAGTARHCGGDIIGGEDLPEDWRGNLLTCQFKTQEVQRFTVNESEAGYAIRQTDPLLTTTFSMFRPVDVKQGPDGAIYVADWYNEIINHAEVDFRDKRRDHSHGRIWRITRTGSKHEPLKRLDEATTENLLAQLQSNVPIVVQLAKRTLGQRDPKSVAATVSNWAEQLDSNVEHFERHRLEALWTLQTLDVVEPKLLQRVLQSNDPRVRAAAARVAGYWHSELDDAVSLLEPLAADPDARVRLEAVLALTRIPSHRSIEAALVAVEHPQNALLDFALTKAVQTLKPYWLPEFEAGRVTFAGRPARISFALTHAGAQHLLSRLVDLDRSGDAPAGARGDVLMVLAAVGDTEQIDYAYKVLTTDKSLGVSPMVSIIRALAQRNDLRPSNAEIGLARLLASRHVAVRVKALELVGGWQMESSRESVASRVMQKETAPQERRAAIAALVRLGGAKSDELLSRVAASHSQFAARAQATAGLIELNDNAASIAAGLLQSAGASPASVAELFEAFLGRKGGAELLAVQFEARLPLEDNAKVGLRVLYAIGKQEPRLETLLRQASGVAARNIPATPSQIAQLATDALAKGNAERGEAIFHRRELSCLRCHAMVGAGGNTGPDLLGIGTSAPMDYLVESLLAPSKKVKEGYVAATVVTVDGRVITGIKVNETETLLTLRPPLRDDVVLRKEEIDEQFDAGSIMPAGLVDLLTRQEQMDLIQFLSQLGRPGKYGPSPRAFARSWSVLGPTAGIPSHQDLDAIGGRVAVADASAWQPAISRVGGDLTLDDLPALDDSQIHILRCQLNVTRAGLVTIQVTDPRGISLLMGGESRLAKAEIAVELAQGTHEMIWRVDASARDTNPLQVELKASDGSAQRASFGR